jgi:glycosyltransferase involved in cell wall biosynthesis
VTRTGTPRVLELVNMVPNKRGPVELQLAEMARQSTERGWAMDIVFPAQPPDWYADALAAAGCEVHTIPALDGDGRDAVLEHLGRAPTGVAHLHFVRPAHYASALRRHGVRGVVRTEHTFVTPSRRIRSLARAYRYRGVDVTVACSRSIFAQTRREYRVPPRRIRTVLNGVDLDLFRPPGADKQALREKWTGLPADAFVVTVAAHFTARKRIDMTIRAFADVLAAQPRARLVLAGNGAELPRYRQLIADLGLDPVVLLLTGDNLIAEIYGASDVAVLTSWGEGLPGGAVEAMACGIPLVATAAPGSDEVPEHGVSGLLVDHEASAVAAAMLRLGESPELRARMGMAARRRAEEHFDVRRTARETLDIYAPWMR